MNRMFITFEGGEGSGKTTIIKEVTKKLEELGYSFITTREPGGVEIAEEIRNIILDPKNTKMCYETEALLYAASRMQHLKEKILPSLDSGKIVICDRYLDSSLVYQGYTRKIGFEDILKINSFAEKHMPNLTFFIDVRPSVGLKRLEGRQSKLDRLDLENLSFHDSVYEGYLKLCEMYPERIVRINGEKDKDEVINDVMSYILKALK